MAEGIKLGLRISPELDARLTHMEGKTGLKRGDIVRWALSVCLDNCSVETVSRSVSNSSMSMSSGDNSAGSSPLESGSRNKNQLKRMRKKRK